MSQILQLFALLILIGSVAQGGASPPATHSLTPNTQFIGVEVESNPLLSGQTQNLFAKMESSPGELVILTLSITYPNGVKHTVVGSTLNGEAILSWPVPPDAGRGTAKYRLTSSGCGCGSGQDGKPKAPVQKIAEGSFTIE
jgi:hypothetical protein